MSKKKIYEGIGGDEFGRFDKVMRGLLAVPYQELRSELAKHKKKKARKKRAKRSTSGRAACRDSEAGA
ncbi:MAG TPA: hypothetical protein VI685_14985 [Candidatus Angelobacter sp.]